MAEYKHSILITEEKRILLRLSSDFTSVKLLHKFSTESARAGMVIIYELCVVTRTTPETVMLVDCVSIPTYGFISTAPYANPINVIFYGG